MKRFVTLLCLAFSLAAAEPLKVGDTVSAFSAKDQHGKDFIFKPGARYLIVSFDMSTGKEVNRVLEKKGANYLDDTRAVFVSNIHGMPAIGRVFALPKMRKYPHRIILADDEKLLEPFPKQKDRVTVLALDEQARVAALSYWDPEKQPLEEVLR